MSNNLSTAITIGAKIPFMRVMKLSQHDRIIFIEKISPNMAAAQKSACINLKAH